MKRQTSSRRWWLLPFVFNPTCTTTTAFTLRITNHHRSPTRLHETTTSIIDDKDFLALLDESVFLYSQVQHSSLSTDKEIERDLRTLRETEVTALVEDIVYTYAQTNKDDDDDDEQPSTTTTLYELSQQLDQAILDGYQSTFTQDELDEWVHHINSLYSDFKPKLAAAASGASEPATITTTTSRPLEALQTRLEQLRTLIAPTSLLPARHQQLVTSFPLNQKSDDSSSKQQTIIAVVSDPSGVMERSADTLLTVVEGDNDDDKPDETDSKESLFFATLSNEESNATTMTTSSVETATSQEESSDSIITSKEEKYSSDGLDAINAVVSLAALGAVAVTKVPFFAAGIALGPLIKSSIAYAQNAMNVRTRKNVGIGNANATQTIKVTKTTP